MARDRYSKTIKNTKGKTKNAQVRIRFDNRRQPTHLFNKMILETLEKLEIT